jgi:hypothetical protein
MLSISQILQTLRINHFSSIQASDFMTIALNSLINRDTITEILRAIRRIFLSTIEDSISTRINIRIFRINSIEFFRHSRIVDSRKLISNSSVRNRIRRLNLMMLEIIKEQSCRRQKIFRLNHSRINDKTDNFKSQKSIIRTSHRIFISMIIHNLKTTSSSNTTRQHIMTTTSITRTDHMMKF